LGQNADLSRFHGGKVAIINGIPFEVFHPGHFQVVIFLFPAIAFIFHAIFSIPNNLPYFPKMDETEDLNGVTLSLR
jgi:hypothetical protein